MNVVRMKTQPSPAATNVVSAVSAPPVVPSRWKTVVQGFQRLVIPPVIGIVCFTLVWAMVSATSDLPGPVKTFDIAVQVFSDPFYDKGPNDQGIGWNVLMSLSRVGMGFGMAALVGFRSVF